MPALAPYIPNKDAAFGAWLDNFSATLTAAPASYGMTTAQAAGVAAVTAAWDAAYALVTSPATKTATTVQAKNEARINATATVRPLAQQISLNAGVTTDQKTAIGVNPRTSVPVPITAPTTYPSLTLTSIIGGNQVISYRDSIASPSVKAKPYGVVQIQLYGVTSTTVITDPTSLPLLQVTTKSPLQQPIPPGPAAGTSYYAARWVTRKGLVGPWSPIVS
jgi:hypothetical protein